MRERRARSPPPAHDVEDDVCDAGSEAGDIVITSSYEREPAPEQVRETGLMLERKLGADELMPEREARHLKHDLDRTGNREIRRVTTGAHTVALRPATSSSRP